MRIFIDSADVDEIYQSFQWGVVDGVTTNPSLIKSAVQTRLQAGQLLNLDKYITQILKVAVGTPVSLEVTETDAEGMVAQAVSLFRRYNQVAKNVVIKIPINPAFKDNDKTHFDGILAIRKLASMKIPVNCTLIFTPEQALLAAKAGASFVSPFAGRVDDYIRKKNKLNFKKTDYYPKEGAVKGSKLLNDNGIVSGIDLVQQCVEILQYYELPTQVLAASLRNTRQVREAAMAGADVATLPFDVIQEMLKHPKTYEGMKKFSQDIVQDYVGLTQSR